MKMYRHFAVVTILITATLAFVAQGENEELTGSVGTPASYSAGAWQKQPAAAPAAPVAVAAKAQPAPPPSSQGWGDDGGGSSGGGGGYGSVMPTTTASVQGLSEQYLATLSAEERARLQVSLAEAGVTSPEELERRNAEMLAASARRSGSGTRGDES